MGDEKEERKQGECCLTHIEQRLQHRSTVAPIRDTAATTAGASACDVAQWQQPYPQQHSNDITSEAQVLNVIVAALRDKASTRWHGSAPPPLCTYHTHTTVIPFLT